jgi:hypothetical protein
MYNNQNDITDHFCPMTGIRMLSAIFAMILFWAASGLSFSGSISERLDSARVQIIAVSQTLHDGRRPNKESVTSLSTSLSLIFKTPVGELPLREKTDADFALRLEFSDSLMGRFQQLYSANFGVDTLQSTFKELRQSFLNTFAEYFYTTGMASHTKKVILFSTSMSCACTLKMCEDQEFALYFLGSSHPDLLTVIVVDAFLQDELVKKHTVTFLPTVVVLDESNKELARFEHGEKIREIIESLINE